MWRHDLDPLALMAGILFSGLGVAFLAGGFELPMRWIGPVLLIVVGIIGLVVTRPRAQRGAVPIGGQMGEADGTDPT